jgi:hypothetical protein
MTPEDRVVIESWSTAMDGSVRISMILTEDGRSAMIRDFCEELNIIAPFVVIGE